MYLILSIGILLLCSGTYSEELPQTSDQEDIPVVEGFGTVKLQEEDHVLILDKDNFDQVTFGRPFLLVEFYAPWCGHCKTLAPEYAAAAKELKAEGFQLAKVDVTVEIELAKRFDITSYPTVKLFKKDKETVEFDGPSTKQGIVQFMREQADPNYQPPASAVEELDAESFPEFVDLHPLSLVEFFTPWCGHCKTLAPEYEAAALDLQESGIPLAKVDATEEKELSAEYEVTGYPTLFIFRKGRKFDYKGPRDRTGIVSYMREHAKPPSKEVKSAREVKNIISKAAPYVFAIFANDEEALFKKYLEAANELREQITFIHAFDATLGKAVSLEMNSINVIIPEIYHSKFEKKKYTFSKGDAKSTEILTWIQTHNTPLVGLRTKSNLITNYEKRPLLVVYYDVNFDYQYLEDTQYIRNKVLPIANRHKDFSFAISNEEEFMDELKSFGLDDSGEDVNAAIFGANGFKYPMEPDDFTEETLEEFVIKFKKGLLKPHLKSKPIPKRQDGPVMAVVANNFDDALLQNEKDVLIEFYAPWCGHCKSLEPVYKQVAQSSLKTYPNLIVAKMDGTANDVMSIFTLKGFPTIYFLKGTDKATPISFEGERNYDGFMTFIKEHSTAATTKDEL